ncbi:MAG: hypothetical protein IPG66_14950 [Hydrogenophilales bacterium]|nr:hypothetical protein [Hydrogenophilales bacterium]
MTTPTNQLRIVEYRIDYTHRVQVGVVADCDDTAIALAQAAFDAGAIWDNTPEMPLLYDDYDEVEDETLIFRVVATVARWPEPAVCVVNATRDAAARETCRLLMLAEALRVGQLGAEGEYQRTLDQAYRMAAKVFGGPEVEGAPRPRVVVAVEGGLVQGASSDLPVELVVVDYDVKNPDDGALAIPQSGGGESLASLAEQVVEIYPGFVEDVWRLT